MATKSHQLLISSCFISDIVQLSIILNFVCFCIFFPQEGGDIYQVSSTLERPSSYDFFLMHVEGLSRQAICQAPPDVPIIKLIYYQCLRSLSKAG